MADSEQRPNTQPNGDAGVSDSNHNHDNEKTQSKGAKHDLEKLVDKQKLEEKMKMVKPEKQPPGGYDSMPIPSASRGYTVKFTFHRATNLPMADINSLSSDPFVLAQLKTDLPKRHKEDPPFMFRTPTIRRNTNPEWNAVWIVSNVPASGFRLKARLYDEDPADHDDRLGNAHIDVDHIDENWPGIHEQSYKVKKRMGSKRAYFIRGCAALFQRGLDMSGELTVSVEVLGRTEGDAPGGQLYTAGPMAWTKHFSPLLGRISGTKAASDDNPGTERYNFQANQIQLAGPVPSTLYHRYVEFKPFIGSMFTTKGVRGWILNRALHHQHARVYNFDRTTVYGSFDEPCRDMTLKFLDLVHYDQGGRIFTYVLTLDGQLRFTETGKEFGIDLLSKHTMHSDVSIYIAFSGEFFIRRHTRKNHFSDNEASDPTHPPEDIGGGPPKDEPPKDPAYYELVIDNDSGTYRPNAKLLPDLKSFIHRNLPGIKVLTLDCNGDKEKMDRLKTQQRERKKTEGDAHVYVQGSDAGSISSSDEEMLDTMDGDDGNGNGAGDIGVSQGVKTVLHGPKQRVEKFQHPGKARRERIETLDDQETERAEQSHASHPHAPAAAAAASSSSHPDTHHDTHQSDAPPSAALSDGPFFDAVPSHPDTASHHDSAAAEKPNTNTA
ncbi:hypothetical protein L228DRAFT_281678 [Xylona heveae TC161]|uniref:C2 domain-containing protein n=1 Tax=Xylona heveae (strain CBS 132557 / TC161) TaxID=1328760 RepID=A0A165IAD7_XYLHT|nr:hypothetical protein L228DRAFT_281678 [Xylona heveae TC161]KZF24621.1 hypothetical protein L228DRAFT_281678 [Xylona heveae TC161]